MKDQAEKERREHHLKNCCNRLRREGQIHVSKVTVFLTRSLSDACIILQLCLPGKVLFKPNHCVSRTFINSSQNQK